MTPVFGVVSQQSNYKDNILSARIKLLFSHLKQWEYLFKKWINSKVWRVSC